MNKKNNYSYPVNVIADYLEYGKDNPLYEIELSRYEGKKDVFHLFEYYIENELPDKQLEVIRLYYDKKLSTKEISGQMDITITEVLKIRRRALRRLCDSDFSRLLLYGIKELEDQDYEEAYKSGYAEGYKDGFKDGSDDFANNLGFNERQGNSDVKQLTDLPQILLENLKLPARAYNALCFQRIKTLRGIACLSPKELSNLRNVGKGTYMEIVEVLSQYGVNKTPYIDWLHRRDKKDPDENSNQDIISLGLSEQDLSVRTYNTLLRRGLRTLQDIAALSPDGLRKIKGIEKKGYNEIVRLLKKYGINTDKY